MKPPNATLALVCLIALVCVCTAGGCTQLPRIDPTGESLFLAPNEVAPPAIVGGQTFAVPSPAAPATGLATPTFGNITAPPVYSDPGSSNVLPSPSRLAPTPVLGATAASGPIAAPVAGVATVAPRDFVRLLPGRVLAPVGSEVVLRAGVCSQSGYLLANQRVEWMLSRESVGQIVTLNNRDELDWFRWPWNTPRKVDNAYAIGATAVMNMCLQRGTPDPTDDVQILRGEAWISVTSPTEGTSNVTAFSPLVEDWRGRSASATIYWIDAQWVFPPSANVEAGRSHVLTTTVSRRSEAAPLAGYLVRYEVAGGGAAGLGYEGGGVANVTTDAAGCASIEVSPTDDTGGSATISIRIIRPPHAGLAVGPEVELGQGSVTLNWGGNLAPLTTAPELEPTSPSTPTPQPTLPPGTSTPPSTYTPPADEPPPGRPNLEVRTRNVGPSQVAVGEFVRYEVTVENSGDAVARNIVLRAEFDPGLRVPDRTGQAVEMTIRDLAPGQSELQNISFEVLQPGELCHTVTATADSGSPGFDRRCIAAEEPPPEVQPAQPIVDVRMLGPRRRILGDRERFPIRIRNTGTVPVTNLVVENRYPLEFEPIQANRGHESLPDRRLVWRLDALDVDETQEFQIEYRFIAASASACNMVSITADGDVYYADQVCMEILPPRDGQTAVDGELPDTNSDAANSAVSPGLELSVSESQNPARAGERMIVRVEILNTSGQSHRDVNLRIRFPPELVPDRSILSPPAGYRIVNNEFLFEPIREIRPTDQRVEVVIPADVARAGASRVWARLEAPGLSTPIETSTDEITILPR